MNFVKLAAISAAFIVGSQAPVFAASQTTATFLANLQTNVSFLDRSSRLASERSTNPALRDFARDETIEQAQLAHGLTAVMPLIAATENSVVTGRSVAIDGQDAQAAAAAPSQAANGRSPLSQTDAESLAMLSGRALEDRYWETQLDALNQLEADYRAYIATGDDPALVAMARAELPKIMRRLELLSKI